MIAFDKNHIPLLTVIINPTGEHPVILTMSDDWQKTGEYILSATPLEALEVANVAMQQAANFMADELWDMLLTRKRMGEHHHDEENAL